MYLFDCSGEQFRRVEEAVTGLVVNFEFGRKKLQNIGVNVNCVKNANADALHTHEIAISCFSKSWTDVVMDAEIPFAHIPFKLDRKMPALLRDLSQVKREDRKPKKVEPIFLAWCDKSFPEGERRAGFKKSKYGTIIAGWLKQAELKVFGAIFSQVHKVLDLEEPTPAEIEERKAKIKELFSTQVPATPARKRRDSVKSDVSGASTQLSDMEAVRRRRLQDVHATHTAFRKLLHRQPATRKRTD